VYVIAVANTIVKNLVTSVLNVMSVIVNADVKSEVETNSN